MGYRVAAREARFEQEIKRSRFIGIGCRVSSPEEAAAALAERRREFPDATHHCSAYLLGDPRNSSNMRADDDGEPAGTAGKPMLNVLQHKNVGDVLLVVVRYFGGIKLGAGGLVRAYSSTASGTMDALEWIDAGDECYAMLALDYPDEPPIPASARGARRDRTREPIWGACGALLAPTQRPVGGDLEIAARANKWACETRCGIVRRSALPFLRQETT